MSHDHEGAFPCDNTSHEAIASWFLGPKAENHEFMKNAFNDIVEDLCKARKAFHPEDDVRISIRWFQMMLTLFQPFITGEVQRSEAFLTSMDKLKSLLNNLSTYMSDHNIPFYSPRYGAHMTSDATLPGILGYLVRHQFSVHDPISLLSISLLCCIIRTMLPQKQVP